MAERMNVKVPSTLRVTLRATGEHQLDLVGMEPKAREATVAYLLDNGLRQALGDCYAGFKKGAEVHVFGEKGKVTLNSVAEVTAAKEKAVANLIAVLEKGERQPGATRAGDAVLTAMRGIAVRVKALRGVTKVADLRKADRAKLEALCAEAFGEKGTTAYADLCRKAEALVAAETEVEIG